MPETRFEDHQALQEPVFRPEIRQAWVPGIRLDESNFGIDTILTY